MFKLLFLIVMNLLGWKLKGETGNRVFRRIAEAVVFVIRVRTNWWNGKTTVFFRLLYDIVFFLSKSLLSFHTAVLKYC